MSEVPRRDLAFPLRRDISGRFAEACPSEHLRDLIAQVLFTLPGERLEQPEFGAGVQRLVFEPIATEQQHRVQFEVQAQLQRWLAQRLRVDAVELVEVDSRLAIQVTYTATEEEEPQVARYLL